MSVILVETEKLDSRLRTGTGVMTRSSGVEKTIHSKIGHQTQPQRIVEKFTFLNKYFEPHSSLSTSWPFFNQKKTQYAIFAFLREWPLTQLTQTIGGRKSQVSNVEIIGLTIFLNAMESGGLYSFIYITIHSP